MYIIMLFVFLMLLLVFFFGFGMCRYLLGVSNGCCIFWKVCEMLFNSVDVWWLFVVICFFMMVVVFVSFDRCLVVFMWFGG